MFQEFMPRTKSAKKALRQSEKRRLVSARRKVDLKKVLKEYKKLLVAKDKEKAREQLKTVYKKLDKAAKVNLIKKNTASRMKSRLTKKLA